jgi:hypothetical protein
VRDDDDDDDDDDDGGMVGEVTVGMGRGMMMTITQGAHLAFAIPCSVVVIGWRVIERLAHVRRTIPAARVRLRAARDAIVITIKANAPSIRA